MVGRLWLPVRYNGDLTTKILAANGIPPEAKEEFLNTPYSSLSDIKALPGAKELIEALKGFMGTKDMICIYADYDVDGLGAAVVAFELLTRLNIDAYIFINNKYKHGYGLNTKGLQDLRKRVEFPKTRAILTVDNGIGAHEGIKEARKMGLKVWVTDHHEVELDKGIPPADIVVDAKARRGTFPFRELSGCGLIFRILRGLFLELGREEETRSVLDMVALSSIVDMAPLVGENRVLVKEGIKEMNLRPRPAMLLIKDLLGIDKFTSGNISFQIGPYLNSMATITGDMNEVCEFMMTRRVERRIEIGTKLFDYNNQRKQRSQEQTKFAKGLVKDQEENHFLFVAHEQIQKGSASSVASKLLENYARPVMVATIKEDGFVAGSARSDRSFNLQRFLNKYRYLFLTLGGHSMACGFSMREDQIPKLRASILADPEIQALKPIKQVEYIMELDRHSNILGLMDEMDQLEPFGVGFQQPKFKLGYIPAEFEYFGQGHEHVRFRMKNMEVVGFNLDERMKKMYRPDVGGYMAVGSLKMNRYKGKEKAQFIIDSDHLVPQKTA